MPEPTHPPYSQGAQAIPRMLNRWLDINAQNGPLTRTLSYITLPAFSVAVDWKGYSELVAAFNYEGPNNFTLKSVPVVTNPNYVLCIMWEDDERVTHRYALWRGVGEVFYFSAPVYNLKQPGLIKRNFRFEVWSTNNTPATQSSGLVFYTSVRGDLDYRFGDDFTLVSTDGLVNNFGDNIESVTPVLPTTNLTAQFVGSGVNSGFWFSNYGPLRYFQGGGLTKAQDPAINNNYAVPTGNSYCLNDTISVNSITMVGLVIKPTANQTRPIFALSNDLNPLGNNVVCQLSQDGSNLLVNGNVIYNNYTVGTWYYVAFFSNFTSGYTYGYCIPITGNMTEPTIIQNVDAVVSANVLTFGSNTVGDPTASYNCAEILVYGTQLLPALRNSIIKYIQDKYAFYPWALPLTFPSDSTPTIN